eukprot:TRINITY_DN6936_c0_g1_i4.p1 TRINITY_DN6936_c0_g1~~TRINITY_DN6936_c0_g1_i4.p1  ORF type:complete len:159 (-),score=37.21 TRINITY_DN6936_c0_g1_i4:20-496(-)
MAADIEALMDYLASPDCQLVNDMDGDMKEEDLADVLAEGGGLADTLAVCNDLNEDGESFRSLPELVEAIKDRRIEAERVKQDMKEILDEPGSKLLAKANPVPVSDVEGLYADGGAGLDSAAHLREMVADGKRTPGNLEEIGRAVQQECRDRSRMPSSA